MSAVRSSAAQAREGRIIALHREDWTNVEIAAELGLCAETVSRIIARNRQRPSGGQRLFALIPHAIRNTKVADLHQGAAAVGHLIVARIKRSASLVARVLIDPTNGRVYAAMKDGEEIRNVIAAYPQVLVGVYDGRADAGQIAADVETWQRENAR